MTPAESEYTCPSHPEVRHIGPGGCPTCSMALEAVTPTDEPPEDIEYKRLLRRFWISAIISIHLIFISVSFRHYVQSDHLQRIITWVEFFLASPVVLWGGWPLFLLFFKSVAERSLNRFTLIGLGIVVTYGYSLAALFSDPMTGEASVCFEAPAGIVTLALLGWLLSLRNRTS